jgi:hypothetical protein
MAVAHAIPADLRFKICARILCTSSFIVIVFLLSAAEACVEKGASEELVFDIGRDNLGSLAGLRPLVHCLLAGRSYIVMLFGSQLFRGPICLRIGNLFAVIKIRILGWTIYERVLDLGLMPVCLSGTSFYSLTLYI